MPEHTTQRPSARIVRSLLATAGLGAVAVVAFAAPAAAGTQGGAVASPRWKTPTTAPCTTAPTTTTTEVATTTSAPASTTTATASTTTSMEVLGSTTVAPTASSSTTTLAALGSTIPAPTTTAAPPATLPKTGSPNVMPATIFGLSAVVGGALLARRRRDVAAQPVKHDTE